jgi:hypothetical protein
MPRMYIVNSWVGSAEYPDGDEYNGQQIGNRQQKSIGVQIERSGDQWRTVGVDQHFTGNGAANTKAYADDRPSKKPVQKRSAFSQACLSDNNYERLQRISESLDDELESGVLSVEDWNYAKKNLQPRIDRAWKKIAQNRGWDEQEEIEESYQSEEDDTNNKSKKSWTSHVQCNNLVVNSLSDDNIFRQAYLMMIKLRGWFK